MRIDKTLKTNSGNVTNSMYLCHRAIPQMDINGYIFKVNPKTVTVLLCTCNSFIHMDMESILHVILFVKVAAVLAF